MKKTTPLRIIFSVAALAMAIAGYITEQTWLYLAAVMVVIVGVAVLAPRKKQ